MNEAGAAEGVLVVRLNRPAKLNGFTVSMSGELCDVFMSADLDARVRCVVLTAVGPKFCVGADFSALHEAEEPPADTGLDESRLYRDVAGRVTVAMRQCRKPIIAAIQGDAVGVGITMCLAADLRVCADTAVVGFVFVRRGLLPEGMSSYLLPRLVGMTKAMEWCLLGSTFRARDEAHSGLFTAVVPPADVLPRALHWANEICTKCSPLAVTLARAMLWNSQRMTHPEEAHELESRLLGRMFQSADFAEGAASFLERRPAQFPPLTSLPPEYPWWQAPDCRPLFKSRVLHAHSKL